MIKKFNIGVTMGMDELVNMDGRCNHVLFAIDASASTDDTAFGLVKGPSVFQKECESVCKILDTMKSMRGQRCTIVTMYIFYGDDHIDKVMENVLLSSIDTKAFAEQLKSIKPSSRTPLGRAVLTMIEDAEKVYKEVRKQGGEMTYPLFVVLTDGRATDEAILEKAYVAMDALYSGPRAHCTMIPVGISPYAGNNQAFPQLERLVQASGHQSSVISDIAHFEDLVEYVPATALAISDNRPRPVMPSALRPVQAKKDAASPDDDVPTARPAAPRPAVGGKAGAPMGRPATPPPTSGGYNRPAPANQGGYNRPAPTNQGGYNRPAPTNQGGYNNRPSAGSYGSVIDLPVVDVSEVHRYHT